MHEIAETSTSALTHLILSTACFSEVCNRRQFGVDWRSIIPSVVQTFRGFLRIFLTEEFHVNITNEMISQIIAHVHLLNVPILLFKLQENVFKEAVIVVLTFNITHDVGGWSSILHCSSILWILEKVGQKACLAERGSVV